MKTEEYTLTERIEDSPVLIEAVRNYSSENASIALTLEGKVYLRIDGSDWEQVAGSGSGRFAVFGDTLISALKTTWSEAGFKIIGLRGGESS